MKHRARLLFLWLLLAGCALRPGMQVEPGLVDGWYVCTRVIDGDTFEVRNVGSVRFAQGDAPELDEPGGDAARRELASKIEGQVIFLQFKRKSDGQPVRGYYGRPLILYVSRNAPPAPR